jgi:hypothetical protein
MTYQTYIPLILSAADAFDNTSRTIRNPQRATCQKFYTINRAYDVMMLMVSLKMIPIITSTPTFAI